MNPMNPVNAINTVAADARKIKATGRFGMMFLVALALSACSALPDKPLRAALYDFGPGLLNPPPATRQAPLPPLALADISTPGGALDNQAVLYRLAYADAQQLRPYSQARWSMPPAQLVRQRLRETLGRDRAVFNAGEGPALNRSAALGPPPRTLQLQLEEFSHLFQSPASSTGLVRLHATFVENTPSGEKLLAQRYFTVQRPATSADAAGGVRALTAATDAAIEEISQWLQQIP
ncbi:MAG: ABC-type transport auxiliary lipoprotein family protein [Polaromonas sp.]|uniref:ABC-type transport auxiliary lipoprotein family protein n=1 Tax=Polaromonas sp. TaxID=1869339 RepID=UPI0024898B22|nr:ABC-type transport auxiliary lipoprotein family protein [Polaromonas sp.]MDI1240139.1 ABC-type transport auxiliary lipoprotein family protein [Polaromonas sp.]